MSTARDRAVEATKASLDAAHNATMCEVIDYVEAALRNERLDTKNAIVAALERVREEQKTSEAGIGAGRGAALTWGVLCREGDRDAVWQGDDGNGRNMSRYTEEGARKMAERAARNNPGWAYEAAPLPTEVPAPTPPAPDFDAMADSFIEEWVKAFNSTSLRQFVGCWLASRLPRPAPPVERTDADLRDALIAHVTAYGWPSRDRATDYLANVVRCFSAAPAFDVKEAVRRVNSVFPNALAAHHVDALRAVLREMVGGK